MKLSSFFDLHGAQNIGKGKCWLASGAWRKNKWETIQQQHPRVSSKTQKKVQQCVVPWSVCRREHYCWRLCVNVKIGNLEFHRRNDDVIFAQQLLFEEIKSISFGVSCCLFWVCVCMHASRCADVYTHIHSGLCGAECASVSSSIFNIFKILNENVAVNFKLIWMDSNKMQTSLQIRIFSEDF